MFARANAHISPLLLTCHWLLRDVRADSRGREEDMRCGAICKVSSATRALKTRTMTEEQRTVRRCGALSKIAEKDVGLLLKLKKCDE